MEDIMTASKASPRTSSLESTLVHPETVAPETTATRIVRYTAVALRLSLGFTFLWAFFDKTFGLGHETKSADSWLNGGSPTNGFLAFAAKGPFKGFYNDIAGQGWADALFMLGLLGVGTALVLGITMRIAAAAGSLMLVMMWSVVLPPENNLFMDDHLIYALVLILLAAAGAGRAFGLGRRWEQLSIVQRLPWLK
jgi:thiosulfate dehydrogenase [quinone] large subunit